MTDNPSAPAYIRAVEAWAEMSEDSLLKDSVFRGIVTQAGRMNDGNAYNAAQACELRVVQRDGKQIWCAISRAERLKYVNGSRQPALDTPEYLRQYLGTNGACCERASGIVEGGIAILEGVPSHVTEPSDVFWSPHKYYIIVGSACLMGLALNTDRLEDRQNSLGCIMLMRSDHSEKH